MQLQRNWCQVCSDEWYIYYIDSALYSCFGSQFAAIYSSQVWQETSSYPAKCTCTTSARFNQINNIIIFCVSFHKRFIAYHIIQTHFLLNLDAKINRYHSHNNISQLHNCCHQKRSNNLCFSRFFVFGTSKKFHTKFVLSTLIKRQIHNNGLC